MPNRKATRREWIGLAALALPCLLYTMDLTVLNLAVPHLVAVLKPSAVQLLWIVDIYGFLIAGSLITMGTLGDRIGRRKVLLAGAVLFGIASVIAAFSTSAEMLIAARALLGIAGATLAPSTLSLIRNMFHDASERTFAISIWATSYSVGAAIGPLLGGVLLEYFWWGSVFLINVPVVLAALLAGATLLTNRPGNRDHPWDLAGSVQVMIGLVGLTYAIKEIAKRDPSWPAAALAFAVGLAAMTVFVRRQLASRAPLIDFSLFANPRFCAGVATAVVASAALIGVELVFSQRLQLVLGLSPLRAGLIILPIPLAAFVAGPVTGLVLPRVGAVRVLWSSLLLAGITLVAYLLVYRGETWLWLTALSLMGFGFGAAMTAASSVIMLSAPEERAGMAASIEEVSFELGGALGIALLGSLMSALYTYALVLPNGVAAQAADSLDEALLIAEKLAPAQAAELTGLAGAAFDQAFVGVIAGAAVLLIFVSLVIWRRTATV